MTPIEYDNLLDQAFVMIQKNKASLDDVESYLKGSGIADSDLQNSLSTVVDRVVKAKKRSAWTLVVAGILLIVWGCVRTGLEQGVGFFAGLFFILGLINILLGIMRVSSANKDIE